MSSRRDFYHRQRVTEAELDEAFDALEQADRDLASDLGIRGVISGAVAVPHSPVPDLTVDLTAPGRAYDRLGRRIFIAAGQRIDVSRDLNGLPTQINQAGQERWIGIYIRFSRLLSEPRTDGNGQVVYWKRDESFEVVVRQGAAAQVGQSQRPPLEPDELLVADIKRHFNHSQIIPGDIYTDRRQAFIFSPADNVSVETGGWSVLDPADDSVQSTFDRLDEILDAHFDGSDYKHSAGKIDASTHGFLTGSTVQAQLDGVSDVLAVNTGANPGATRIGARSVSGSPNQLQQGNVDGQLAALLTAVNNHAGSTSAHAASSITATARGTVTSTTVQGQLEEIVTDLAKTDAGASGAGLVGGDAISGTPTNLAAGTLRSQLSSLLTALNNHASASSGAHAASAISVADTDNRLTATTVEAALSEVLQAFEADHLRGNQTTPGQHRTIHQSAQGDSGKALLWEAKGTTTGVMFRVYLSGSELWLTLNASASGSSWLKDAAGPSSAIVLGRSGFDINQHHTDAPMTFSSWSRGWFVSMGDADNNSGWRASGAIKDRGRLGLSATNFSSGIRACQLGANVSFRVVNNANVTSVTYTPRIKDNVLGNPDSPTDLSALGFYATLTESLGAGVLGRWIGDYTAA